MRAALALATGGCAAESSETSTLTRHVTTSGIFTLPSFAMRTALTYVLPVPEYDEVRFAFSVTTAAPGSAEPSGGGVELRVRLSGLKPRPASNERPDLDVPSGWSSSDAPWPWSAVAPTSRSRTAGPARGPRRARRARRAERERRERARRGARARGAAASATAEVARSTAP